MKSLTGRETGRTFGAGLRLLLLLMTGGLAFAPSPTPAQPAATKEYHIKAACLFNFAQFVEWPPKAFSDPSTPINIGILGEDPFGKVLEQTVEGESIHSRKLVVQRSRQIEDLKNCHLVFISRSEKGRLDQVLGSLAGTTILTVGETDQFVRRGGIINFFLEGNKVRFEINTAAAQRNGLKISSQLLKLGKVVGS